MAVALFLPRLGTRNGNLVLPMAKHTDNEAHLNALRALCEQAEKLRQVAEELCSRLTTRMEATRVSLRLPPPHGERRRKMRKHR